MNRNKWGQLTSLYGKKSGEVVSYVGLCCVLSVSWSILACTHCLPCFWTVLVKETDVPRAMPPWRPRPPADNLKKLPVMEKE